MQTYPQYYPQMNNYGQQYNPQQPYMDRLAGLQQYQQTLQQPQMQMQTQQMPIGLNGKVVDIEFIRVFYLVAIMNMIQRIIIMVEEV